MGQGQKIFASLSLLDKSIDEGFGLWQLCLVVRGVVRMPAIAHYHKSDLDLLYSFLRLG